MLNSKEFLEEVRNFIKTLENIYNAKSIKINNGVGVAEKINRITINSSSFSDGFVSCFNF